MLTILNYQNTHLSSYMLPFGKQINSSYFYTQKIIEYMMAALFDASKNYSKM